MAKQTIVQLIDDFSGESLEDGAGRTVSFALDGAQYEIDLSTSNIEELQQVLQRYIDAARRVGSSPRKTTAGRRVRGAAELQEIRAWARANGHEVSDRGRLPEAVLEAYRNR